MPTGLRAPSVALSDLIRSAERFPPTLALARSDCLNDGHLERDPLGIYHCTAKHAVAEFEERLGLALRGRLEDARLRPATLARVVREASFAFLGQWYWVIARDSGGRSVTWVADDLEIYQDVSETFDLTSSLLGSLPFRSDLLRC